MVEAKGQYCASSGFLDRKGGCRNPDGCSCATIADLEHQIAELRAAVDTQRQSKEFAQRCCEKAEAENARLRALPLKDEVERVLGMIASSVDAGITENDKHHRIRLKDGSHVKDGYLVGPTADDLRNSFVAIRDAARSLLSRLRAGEQEWCA